MMGELSADHMTLVLCIKFKSDISFLKIDSSSEKKLVNIIRYRYWDLWLAFKIFLNMVNIYWKVMCGGTRWDMYVVINY